MSFSKLVDGHVVRIAGWRRMFRALMLSAVCLFAQSGDWAQVQALTSGAQVEVKRFSGGPVHGLVESASEDGLVVQGDGGSVALDRADVKRVRLRSEEKTNSGRIAGTVILGTLGIAGAAISDKQQGGSGVGRVLSVPFAAGIGYLIGWAADGPKKITLYKGTKP